jgi:ribonuclease D
MKIHPLITTTEQLADLCERLAKSEFVAVDTEFMRENTYYPLLCLVQLGNEEEAAAIDPLAEGIDLAPMLELFCNNEDILKVFHAAGRTSRSSTISPARRRTRSSTPRSR